MSDKKFPTPSLDAVRKDSGWCSIEMAAQADIALNVKRATKAPEDIASLVASALRDPHLDAEDRDFRCHHCDNDFSLRDDCGPTPFCDDCAHDVVYILARWLESRTVDVATKQETAQSEDRRCGTCAHYSPGDDEYSGECQADFPASATEQCPMEPEKGKKCPCWKAGTL